ncbi:MAG: PKD domain-containing protein [Candidatus Wallbacteria bacterium]|nr:PKD domain-containing protein [Candidatus Wallbacteria bacterium]
MLDGPGVEDPYGMIARAPMARHSLPPAGLLLAVTAVAACAVWAQVNQPPTAVAGSDRSVATGTSVLLDGRSSFDPEGQPLSYRWRFAGLPVASRAVLFGAETPLASFTTDAAGDYFVELTVDDGAVAASDAARVRATGQTAVQRPVAIARAPGTVNAGQRVTIDGSGSTSPSGVALTYAWTRVFGNAVELAGADTSRVSFRSFDPGFVTLQLVVADGAAASLPVSVTVIVLDRPPATPAVEAGPDVTGIAGRKVTLSGRVLAPRGAGSVTLRWTYESGPVSELALTDRHTASPSFVPPVPGFYDLRFSAADGQSSDEDRLTVQVLSATAPAASSGGCGLGHAGPPAAAGWLLLGLPLAWIRREGRPAAGTPGALTVG